MPLLVITAEMKCTHTHRHDSHIGPLAGNVSRGYVQALADNTLHYSSDHACGCGDHHGLAVLFIDGSTERNANRMSVPAPN
eukprot:4611710-Amphidinium_carterae.1